MVDEPRAQASKLTFRSRLLRKGDLFLVGILSWHDISQVITLPTVQEVISCTQHASPALIFIKIETSCSEEIIYRRLSSGIRHLQEDRMGIQREIIRAHIR